MITLPWPAKELSPNARCHWADKAKITKKHREDAGWKTVLSKLTVYGDGYSKIDLHITFHPPSRRHYDLDNCLASNKAHLDGIADGLGVNDNRFRLHLEMGDVVKDGCVIVKIGGIEKC